MGERPQGMTLDRIDSKGDYEPTNCKWSTWREQEGNRRDTVYVMVGDERVCLSEAARRLNLSIHRIRYRIKKLGNVQAAIDSLR